VFGINKIMTFDFLILIIFFNLVISGRDVTNLIQKDLWLEETFLA